jgi:hypothetical protein
VVLALTRILEIFEGHDDPALRQPKSQPRPLGYFPTHDRIVGMSTNSPLEEFMERWLRCKKEGYLEEPSINLQVALLRAIRSIERKNIRESMCQFYNQ